MLHSLRVQINKSKQNKTWLKNLVIDTYKILELNRLKFLSSKGLYHSSIQNGEISKVWAMLAIVGDNDLYRHRGSWGWGLHARKNSLAQSIVTPLQCSSQGTHLCNSWVNCSMNRIDGTKESCDCSLLIVLLSSNFSLYLLSSFKIILHYLT